VNAAADFIPLEVAERELPTQPDGDYIPPGEPAASVGPRFKLEPYSSIDWTGAGEWLLQGLLPLQGLAVVYGASGSRKSFIAADLALKIARGLTWAGRQLKQGAAVYIAAEGAAGFRKRVAAFRRRFEVEGEQPFFLIADAPNLGGEAGDREALVASIDAASIEQPLRLIVIDTLAQSLHGAEENGRGMMALISNANALAARFGCLVLIIHHSGKDDERGARGHSSLTGAADALWHVKKAEAGLVSTIAIEKNKDDAGGQTFAAELSRFVLHHDEATGEEVSSLVIEEVSERGVAIVAKPEPRFAPSLRLFMDCLKEATGDRGRDIKPFSDGPMLRAAPESAAREIFYRRAPESREGEDDPKKRAERQRKAFTRARSSALQTRAICATTFEGEGWLWVP